MNKLKQLIFAFVLVILSALILLISYASLDADAAGLPSPDSVLRSYKKNPYIRFYEGSQGIAWTTIHPDGYSLNSNGVYVYGDVSSYYRGTYLTEVKPAGTVSRKEAQGPLPAGHHYYADSLYNTVIPVGKWVLSHVDSRCVHGPFEACRDYEYYGINGLDNMKCGECYDSGWIAYCADCGKEITGFVYTSDACVSRIGYIFAGDEAFRKKYPAEYMFVCPVRGDNLENDLFMQSHVCECFISPNRYRIVYDGNGAKSGNMGYSVCYYGGAEEYEGKKVTGEKCLKDNSFIRPGYAFAGWSDSPRGQVLFSDGTSTNTIENYFTYLANSGEGSNDREIKLYAVWKKADCTLNVSGGYFGSSNGSYDGVTNGSFKSGKNSFAKGHDNETCVNPGLLTPPSGYKVSFVVSGGSALPDMYAGCELTGWLFESSDSAAGSMDRTAGGIRYYGRISGDIKSAASDGSFTYVHSSPVNRNTDTARAVWKSTSVILPEATAPGMFFDGWYTDPGLRPDTYVGKTGDMYFPKANITLYAGFCGLELNASADYMGTDAFGNLRYNGITDLKVPRPIDRGIYKYFISSDRTGLGWTNIHTDNQENYSGGTTRVYSAAGSYSEYYAPVSGIYSFKLWGAAGGSYDEYQGENGEYSSCRLFLNKGDLIGIYTGNPGTATVSSGSRDCSGGEGSYISVNGQVVMSSSGGSGASHTVNVYEEYNYTGSVQSFTAAAEGDYKLQVWGAEGAPTNNDHEYQGKGGYSSGEVHLNAGDVLYICVGGTDGYNGGGTGGCDAYGGVGGNGGGATHIAFRYGCLRELENYKQDVCIVAGGGGGSGGSNASSGEGGGENGGDGCSPWPNGESTSTGGTQISGGIGGEDEEVTYAGFGYGGCGLSYGERSGLYAILTNGGGGGGWYGGGGGGATTKSYGSGGGGGSGYIGGVRNGNMANGIRFGNGYALITFNFSVSGGSATGYGTSFTPGSVMYSDHVVRSHALCEYPSDDMSKAGYCIIEEPSEVLYSTSQCKVYSPDLASPDPVSEAQVSYNLATGSADISWIMPDDKGTDYRYVVKAYHSADIMSGRDVYLATNIESLNIKTGVYYYSYVIDSTPVRNASYVRQNGIKIMSGWSRISGSAPTASFENWYAGASESDKRTGISYTPCGSNRYIHIIATDRAGNDSPVFDMAIDGDNIHIPYPIVTRNMTVEASPGVYAAPGRSGTYYVRADGKSVFPLGYTAEIMGYARKSYQIDMARFHMSGSEYCELSFDKNTNVSRGGTANLLGTSYSGAFTLDSVGVRNAGRMPGAAVFSFTGDFTTTSEKTMYIYPSAHAHLESGWDEYGIPDGLVSSDASSDRSHGVTLIGDATSPICRVSVNGSGYERLRDCNISNVSREYVVDRRCEEVDIDFYVSDAGSGLKGGFTVCVTNLDNGLEGRYLSSGEHFILNLKKDQGSEESVFENMLFNGKFIIKVIAEDNVGNTMSEQSAGLTELDITGEIVRSLDSVTGPLTDADGNRYIKKGESGYVISRVWGYPEAVLVSFEDEVFASFDTLYLTGSNIPDVLSGFDGNVVNTSSPVYYLENNTLFTVPLDYEGDSVKVKITAYKGDEIIIWETECMIASSGTVLDELMTVLR